MFPEVILNYVVSFFDRVGQYIGTNKGESYDAADYWNKNKDRITPFIVQYLKTYADNTWYFKMKKLL